MPWKQRRSCWWVVAWLVPGVVCFGASAFAPGAADAGGVERNDRASAADRPRVVRVSPDNGDLGVDPGISEMVIQFDRAMDPGGMSIVGGGDSFPEIMGRPGWQNDRTMVVPIRLKPNHEYRLSINNERFMNFRSVSGEPAIPYPIRFTTGPGGERGKVAAGSFGDAIDRAAGLLETAYSHRDRLGLDWEAVLAEHRAHLESSPDADTFARRLGVVLARAEDKHIWLDSGGTRFGTYVRPVAPNANSGLVPSLVEDFRRWSPSVVSGRLRGGRVGYIAIGTWDRGRVEEIRVALDAIRALRDCEAMIVDVRLNGGGDELIAREVAGRFTDRRAVYARHRFVDPDAGGGFFGPMQDRVLEPSARGDRFRGDVAVLIGPVCMSSNEAFALMMRSAGARLVGMPTQGSSGNPRGHDLGHGVTLYLPSWQAMTPDGVPFEGVGIAPDIEIDPDPRAFERSDPVLERALDALTGG